ncbi:LysR family transcriptional regulator [Mesobaculum littorinae]|uniref:LysR family transcriptional regulator n=1 Tax=Mesobaculum littorinae TaxID=2486419 RepID=A0A438ALJ2_9RHOB|nr:LysR substrate-binding domain-containing protein [Mesobaculum littorinae]RVV99416.1 LysR family transcriptional regulator [Mesobaculum littorinae]
MPGLIQQEAFEVLEAIDRFGTFAEAAAALHRVPSAISYVIRQLEADLGIEVFDRRRRKAVLTPAGRLLLEEGRRILTANRETRAAATRLARGWEPELRIAIDTLIPRGMLWPIVSICREELPFIQIHILEETLGGTWEALIEERADIAIGADDAPLHRDIEAIGSMTVEFVYCCSVNHPLAHRAGPITEDALKKFPAIVVSDSARAVTPRSIPRSLLDGQPRITVSHMATKIDAIRQGLGVGYCPRAWLVDGLAYGLETLDLETPRPPIDCNILLHRSRRGRTLDWFTQRLMQIDGVRKF